MSETRIGISQKALQELTRTIAVDQKTLDALRDAVPKVDPSALEAFKNIAPKTNALEAARILTDSAGLKEAMRSFQVNQEAVRQFSESIQGNKKALERFSKSLQGKQVFEQLMSGFRIDQRALAAIVSGVRVDRVTFNLVAAEAVRAGQAAARRDVVADIETAVIRSSEEPVSLQILAELYDQLPGKNRRELRDKLVGALVATAIFIDRLWRHEGDESGWALMGVLLALLFLYTGVVNAFDVLEEEHGGN